MIVYVAFKFNGILPDGQIADEILREITESCETMQIEFDADACWVENAVLEKKEV